MNPQHETATRTEMYQWEPEQTMSITDEVSTMSRNNPLGRTRQLGISIMVVMIVVVATFALIPRHPQAVAAPSTNFSTVPQGLTDDQGLHTAPSANFSHIPQGLMDYQGLHTAAAPSTNFSRVPRGLTDDAGLHTTAAPSTNFSTVPRGLTDYLH